MYVLNLLFSLLLFFFTTASFAAPSVPPTPVRIETKEIDGQIIFVFYHSRATHLRANFNTNLVTVSSNNPITLAFDNESNTKKFASSFSVSSDGMGFSFATKKKYTLAGKIDGEKLTAIKLKPEDKIDTNPQDTQTVEPKNEEEKVIINNIEDNQNQINSSEADAPRKTQIVSISDDKRQNSIIIHFPFPNKTKPQAALFKRGDYIWIVFGTYDEYKIQKNSYINDFQQIPGDVTILKIKTPNLPYISTNTSKDSWDVILSKSAIKSLLITPSNSVPNSLVFPNSFVNPRLVKVPDTEIGDEIQVVLSNRIGAFVINPRSAVDFQILNSFQGLGVILRADNTIIDIKKNTVEINSHYDVPHPANKNAQEISTPIAPQKDVRVSSMLPVITNSVAAQNFMPLKTHLWQKIAESTNDTESYNNKLDLAQLYFMNGLYHESRAMLTLAKDLKPADFNNNNALLFENAVTLTMLGEYKEAKKLYDVLSTKYNDALPEEVALFRSFNEYMLGNTPITLGIVGLMNKCLSLYLEDLYWPLVFAELDLCLQNNNLRTIEVLFKSLRTPKQNSVTADTLKFYKATYYRKKDQLNIAKQLLSELVAQHQDPYNSTRAELELVKISYNAHTIDTQEAIDRLNKIRFAWRGDKVEFDLLLTLAELYKDNKDPVDALRTYKYMLGSFNNQFQNFYISSEMGKIYNEIFLQGGLEAKQLSDFDTVALFYEFRDLTPIGADGDNVILNIAKKLVNLDLLDTAAQLLQHQVTYRLQGEKRIVNADRLALIYIMDNKPQEAVKVLNATDDDANTFKEYLYRQQLKAKAMIDSGKYNEALSYLSGKETDEISQTMKKEAYFKGAKWKEYIDCMNINLNEPIEVTKTENAQDILRLAIAYSMLGKTQDLGLLKQNLKTTNEKLKSIIDFLSITNQPINYNNLDKSLQIDQMKKFLSESKDRLFQ